jgi:hypothetical protein
MPSRSRAKAELRQREINVAKWRLVIRHPAFHVDLNRFRCESEQEIDEAQNIISRGPFPPELIKEEIGNLSIETLENYEQLYTVESKYGDPELLWDYIRPPDASAIPPLNMGKRARLDKIDLYCDFYDLYTKGMKAVDISSMTGKPLPTVKSILKAARKLIERGVGETKFERIPTGEEIYTPNDIMTRFIRVQWLGGIENYPAHEDEADKPFGNWLGHVPNADGLSSAFTPNPWDSVFYPSQE